MSLVRQTLRTSRILFDTKGEGGVGREAYKWTRSVERWRGSFRIRISSPSPPSYSIIWPIVMYKWPLIQFNGPLLKAKAGRYRLFIGYLWLAPFHRRGSFICSIYLPPRLAIGSGRVESSRVEGSQKKRWIRRETRKIAVEGLQLTFVVASGIKRSKRVQPFFLPKRNIEIS